MTTTPVQYYGNDSIEKLYNSNEFNKLTRILPAETDDNWHCGIPTVDPNRVVAKAAAVTKLPGLNYGVWKGIRIYSNHDDQDISWSALIET
jgi:hypothetical protein